LGCLALKTTINNNDSKTPPGKPAINAIVGESFNLRQTTHNGAIISEFNTNAIASTLIPKPNMVHLLF